MTATYIHKQPRVVAKPHSPSSSSSKSKDVYFANVANIVCLFWFNSRQQLDLLDAQHDHSTTTTTTTTLDKLSHLSYATAEFRDYIRRVIHQTQLPPTAVSLALLYILRLKRTAKEPLIACQNSEYRVFSVALILANKFLDDNTYTNKTWSDITKLPLQEVSAMEIEFLSNMRYNMIVHNAEWTKWQSQLKAWLNIAHQCRMSVQPAMNMTTRMFEKTKKTTSSPPLQMPTPPSVSPRNSPFANRRVVKRAYEYDHDDLFAAHHHNHHVFQPVKRPHLASPPQTQYPSPYAPLYPVQTLLAPQMGYPNCYAYPAPPPPPPVAAASAPVNFVALAPYYACHCTAPPPPSVPIATVTTTLPLPQLQPTALYP